MKEMDGCRCGQRLIQLLWAAVTIALLSVVEGHGHGHRRSYSENYDNYTTNGLEEPAVGKDGDSGLFVQIPHSSPPTVRPPPYTISHDKCAPQNLMENWKDTLCGDLNSGYVPQNPMGHKFTDGGTYPFDTIKNKTLQFFRHALPVLKSDTALPKVAKYVHEENLLREQTRSYPHHRVKRGLATREPPDPNPLFFDASYPDVYDYDQLSTGSTATVTVAPRTRRQGNPGSPGGRSGFCDNRGLGYYNRLCKLYNAMWGKSPHNVDRDSSGEIRRHQTNSKHHHHRSHHHHPHSHSDHHHHHHHSSHQERDRDQNLSIGSGRKHLRQAFHSRPDLAIGESDWTNKASKYSHTNRIGGSHRNSADRDRAERDRDLPPTPCPSTAEYLTPVFARNHEGAWRYVVQIPKEGYFTQTVEVTKCLTSTCYYMEGSCKTSPRWQSLLVAELYYPESTFPTTPKTTSAPRTTTKKSPLSILTGAADEYPDYLYSKGSSASLENLSGNAYSNELAGLLLNRAKRSPSPEKKDAICDGHDEVGCYQLRLFYDWFLIPGSCKCWKRQFDFTFAGNNG